MRKIFALVDCNSFYCSCERLFRPDLKNIPVGVLSNNDGCFVSRTNELKKLGVKMGEPYFKVRELCEQNNVAIFSANFSLYTNISDRVMKTLATFSSKIEIYSVDEAFLDLSEMNPSCLSDYAKEIKKVVERNTGIPVSVGIGYTKTLAKIANNIAKKSTKSGGIVLLLNEKHTNIALKRTLIREVWGIGKASELKLRLLGIKNAKEFRDYKNNHSIQKLLTKVGLQTKEELAGKVRFTLELVPIKKKEIMCSRTFSAPIFEIDSLKEAVSKYITNVAEKLRKQNSCCSRISVFMRTSSFDNVSPYFASQEIFLGGDTSDTFRLINHALKAVESLFKEGYGFKKVGVKLFGLVDSNEVQLSLLDRNDTKNILNLMKVTDLINKKNGAGTLRSGACGVNKISWNMNQKFKSPRYLTGYKQLAKVL